MSTTRHDAIVVTSWSTDAIDAAAAKARAFGLEVLGPSAPATNGYRTLLICPDGSKEGWEESTIGDAKRRTFLAYLGGVRCGDGSSRLEWVALAYGNDTGRAFVTAQAWERV